MVLSRSRTSGRSAGLRSTYSSSRSIIVGASDNLGELPRERPIAYQDVLATMYHVLGIDYNKTYLNEANRPVAIINYGTPIREIL